MCSHNYKDISLARIESKRAIELARIKSEPEAYYTHNSRFKKDIRQKYIFISIIIILIILVIGLLSFIFVNKLEFPEISNFLSIASLITSIILSVLAIIFTFTSGLNLENRFHDVDRVLTKFEDYQQTTQNAYDVLQLCRYG